MGEGCKSCHGTGSAQLMTVLEIIRPGEQIRQALYNHDIAGALDLVSQLDQQADGLLSLARRGVITLSETMRKMPVMGARQ